MLLECRHSRLQRALVLPSQFCVGVLLARKRIVPSTGQATGRSIQALGNAVEQTGRALLKGFGKPVQRRAHVLHQRSACALVLRQGGVPDARDHLGGGFEARRQAVQLALHGMFHRLMQRG